MKPNLISKTFELFSVAS